MSKRESFYLPGRELRVQTSADGSRSIVGSIPYNSRSAGLRWIETVAPGAFAGALKAGADCLLLRDHDPSILLGRTLSKTLTLTDSADGLQFRCLLPNTTQAADLLESLSRKDITGVSFGFSVTDDTWADDGAGNLQRTLNAVMLYELSVCSFPAYPDSIVSIRSIPTALRPLLRSKRSNQDGCDCTCDECSMDDDCESCSMDDCEDPDCADNGCPAQDDDDERSRMQMRVELARRK